MKKTTRSITAFVLAVAAMPWSTAAAAPGNPWDPPPLPFTPHCNGRPATIVGSSGVDWLYGTSGDDVIFGGGGDDFLYGNDGNDTICGGDGVDFIVGGQGHDMMIGERGGDHIDAMDSWDPSTGWGWDVVVGGEGRDTLLTRDLNTDLVFGLHMGNWPYSGGSEPDNIDSCTMDVSSIDLDFCRWSS